IFDGENELASGAVNYLCPKFLARPDSYSFSSIDDVNQFIKTQSEAKPAAEGLVLRDDTNMRIKVKSLTWWELNKVRNNGCFNNLINVVMLNEVDELVTYFPEVKDKLFAMRDKFSRLKADMSEYWDKYSVLP